MSIPYDPVRNLSAYASHATQSGNPQQSGQFLIIPSEITRQCFSAPPESSQTFQNAVDFSSQASKMKRSQSASLGAVPRASLMAEKDPENIEIKRLRCEQRMSWNEISEHLNKQRIAKGKHSRFTGNAVYSRLSRNARNIPDVNGEVWESDDEKEQRPKKKRKGGAADIEATKAVAPVTVIGFNLAEDVLLAEAYNEIVRATWVLVS